MELHTALMALTVTFPTALPDDVSVTAVVTLAKQAFELMTQDRDKMQLEKQRLQNERDSLTDELSRSRDEVAQCKNVLLSKDDAISRLETDKYKMENDRDKMQLGMQRLQTDKDRLAQEFSHSRDEVAQHKKDLLSKDDTIYGLEINKYNLEMNKFNLEADKAALTLKLINAERGKEAAVNFSQSLSQSFQERVTALQGSIASQNHESLAAIPTNEIAPHISRKRARPDDPFQTPSQSYQQQRAFDGLVVEESILGQQDVESISSAESIHEPRQDSIDLTSTPTVLPSSASNSQSVTINIVDPSSLPWLLPTDCVLPGKTCLRLNQLFAHAHNQKRNVRHFNINPPDPIACLGCLIGRNKNKTCSGTQAENTLRYLEYRNRGVSCCFITGYGQLCVLPAYHGNHNDPSDDKFWYTRGKMVFGKGRSA